MATTCDYCHKPLSLMRRLRGEQFCSVEHLDQFTAQQAELALERLAASVEEKPLTSRPAPLFKRLPVRQPEPLPEPLPSIATAPVEADGVTAEFDVEHNQADTEAAFSRLAEALADPVQSEATLPATRVTRAVPEYPLATFVAGVEFSPRLLHKQGAPESFAPAETWGRSSYPSALPQLRSQPTDLNEMRTWSAAKLSTKVPPLAPSRSFLVGKQPASFAGPQYGDIEREAVSVAPQTQLPVLDSQIDEVKSEWRGIDAQRMLALLPGFRFPVLHGIPSAASSTMPPDEFQTTIRQPEHHWTPSGVTVLPQSAAALMDARRPLSRDLELTLPLEESQTTALQPEYRWIPSGIVATPDYAPALLNVRKPLSREIEFTLRFETSQAATLQPAFHWKPSPAFVIPETAPVRTFARIPQSGSLVAETNGLEYVMPEGRLAELGSTRPEIEWASAIPMHETWRSCPVAPLAVSPIFDVPSFDAELKPQTMVALPAPPEWTFIEAFEAGRVSMPVWQVSPALAPARPMLSWTGESGGVVELSTTPVAVPGLPRTALVMGQQGPSFGWEQESARAGSGPEACAVHDALVGEGALTPQRLRARVTPVPPFTSLIVAEERSALPGEDVGGVTVGGASEPAASAPRYHDFRARLRTGLLPGERRGYDEWSQPRLDVSMIETQPIAASRPALAEVHADMEQPYRFEPARLAAVSAASVPVAPYATELPRTIPFENAANGFTLSGWPTLTGTTLAVPSRNVITMRSTLDVAVFAEKVQIAGPMRYSPVALVVMPPPQFALLRGILAVEDRFAAQEPLSSRAPRVRATGFRMMGPFPKLPPCLPESVFELKAAEFAPALTDVPRRVIEHRQDLAGIPQFPPSGGYRLHPADYWAWPAIKAPKSSRVAADVAVESPVSTTGPVRRFGPGRVGLQSSRKTADGQPTGA